MSKLSFRLLRADEIDVRVGQQKPSGVVLLLYKDARCDMAILDETVGAMNWMRNHSRDNANCTVSIYDGEKNMWISKEDTGTESNTEAAKGLASDSFKRACVNWGIGRELYTAPFIWVPEGKLSYKEVNGKKYLQDRFSVQAIDYDDNRRISRLVIVSDKHDGPLFFWQARPTDAGAQSEASVTVKKSTTVPAPSAPEALNRKQAVADVINMLGLAGETDFAGKVAALKAGGAVVDKPSKDMTDDEFRQTLNAVVANYGAAS